MRCVVLLQPTLMAMSIEEVEEGEDEETDAKKHLSPNAPAMRIMRNQVCELAVHPCFHEFGFESRNSGGAN